MHQYPAIGIASCGKITSVPPFPTDASLTHPPDYLLAMNGPVHLFWNRRVLADTTAWLASEGYDLIAVDASGWHDEPGMHRALASALGFPDYYGHNVNALDECLGDIASYDYTTTPAALGFALVVEGIDRFAQSEPWAAQRLLDSFARAAHGAALIGHRMLCLVQSSDARIQFEPVGASPVGWNPKEWLDSSRGL